jgi:hypothetical protein
MNVTPNKTFWALKRREWDAKTDAPNRLTRRAKAPTAKAAAVETVEEPSYRDLQAQAKELDIPANQSKEDLAAAIEEASAE